MDMAKRIKERRIAMNLTQEELAAKLGLQKSAVAKYENGRVENIKRSIIQKMAVILECSPAYLMGWDEEDNSTPKYYFDEATAEKAQELYDNPGMRILFDAARDSRPEDLQMAADMLNRLKETNKDG